jgi:hypothetical protein
MCRGAEVSYPPRTIESANTACPLQSTEEGGGGGQGSVCVKGRGGVVVMRPHVHPELLTFTFVVNR